MSTCGLAYVTELIGDDVTPLRPPLDGEGLRSEYALHARRGRRFKIRQLVSLVPSALHNRPDSIGRRREALAIDGRRCLVLFAIINSCVVALFDVYLRVGDLA